MAGPSSLVRPVAMIGIGEIGGVLARGLLGTGCPVYPVTRSTDPAAVARETGAVAAAVVAVGEADLHPCLHTLPRAWRDRTVLLQNELLPRDWERHDLVAPTVLCVWFEKKPGQEAKVLMPSYAHGPAAGLLVRALESVGIPAERVQTLEDLVFQLLRKNVYILTTNIAGLMTGGTVEALWRDHRDTAEAVAREVMQVEAWRLGRPVPEERLMEGMAAAFEADPAHKCTGRSAPRRLQRALDDAHRAGLAVPRLHAIADSAGITG